MTEAARQLLNAFEALPPVDQQEVAAEIVRRATPVGDVPEAAFDELADELFRSYDAEEAAHGDSSAR